MGKFLIFSSVLKHVLDRITLKHSYSRSRMIDLLVFNCVSDINFRKVRLPNKVSDFPILSGENTYSGKQSHPMRCVKQDLSDEDENLFETCPWSPMKVNITRFHSCTPSHCRSS